MMAPDSSYLICATPRSGSTLLGELLTATNVAGRPREHFERLYATNKPRQPREYFDVETPDEVLDLLPHLQPGTPESAEAFDERLRTVLREGTTANGVWSSRLMWGFFLDFLRRLREKPETAALKPAQALAQLFPGLRYVQIKRREKVAQAVSLWTTLQTEGEPVYSFPAIDHLLRQVNAQDQAWASWFTGSGIEPTVVFYEDLAADQSGTVTELLRTLHIDTHAVEVPGAPDPAAQGSDEWVERFEHERKAALA